jgi:hypothetical protein
MSVLAIVKVLKSHETFLAEIESKTFPKYQKFCKSFLITKKIHNRLKLEISKKTLQLCFKLLQECNLKKNQNFKTQVLKKNSVNFFFINIFTFKEKVLQQIIN